MLAHLVQFDIVWEDKPRNFAQTEDLVASANVKPGELIVLPEMFDTGFSSNVASTHDQDALTLTYLRELAQRTGAIVHGSRTGLNADGRGLNLATIVGPDGSVLCEYAKAHLFPLSGATSAEADTFAPGQRIETYTWTQTPSGSVGRGTHTGDESITVCPTICYDLRFPELFLHGLRAGAGLFVVASNWPSARETHRKALSIARAIENQAYVLSVNRCGHDPHLPYAGGTLAIDPRGEIIGELKDQPGVLSVEIDPREIRRWRDIFPAWRSRLSPTVMDVSVR